MTAFVSYSSRDRSTVHVVAGDLRAAGYEPWHDERTPGGQGWWAEILEQIEGCELFVILVSTASVRSRWCNTEIEYADALGKPILPLLIDDVAPENLHGTVRQTQCVDYRTDSRQAGIGLTAAANRLAAVGAVDPNPQLERPGEPIPDLDPIHALLNQPNLTPGEQGSILEQLAPLVDDPDVGPTVVKLLSQLQLRQHVTKDVSDRAAKLLEATQPAMMARTDSQSQDLVRSIATQVQRGRCTPVIGFGITDGMVGSRRALAQHLSERHGFPMAEHAHDDLPRVAQFTSVMVNDDALRDDVGSYFTERLNGNSPGGASAQSSPDAWKEFGSRLRDSWNQRAEGPDPVDIIATLDCAVFVNAHPTSLLADALVAHGKQPVTVLSEWAPDEHDVPDAYRWGALMEREPDFKPTVKRPLVFQVFGMLDVPESVVFTDDNYLDFLTQVGRQDLVPPPVQGALATTALLFLGLELEDRDMKVLLRLIADNGQGRRRRGSSHVAAQLDPDRSVLVADRAKDYLNRYFQFRDPSIGIYWGSAHQLTSQLADLLDSNDV